MRRSIHGSTEFFVEQTLTGFLVLAAAAAPFVSLETLQKPPDEAKGGIDIFEARPWPQ